MKKHLKVGVGLYIFNDKNQVLLGLKKSNSGIDTWSLPGASAEEGESNEQAACRSIKEEAGLKISPQDITFRGVSSNFKERGKHNVTMHLSCRRFSGTPQVMEPEKYACWKWFDVEHLPENVTSADKNFFKYSK